VQNNVQLALKLKMERTFASFKTLLRLFKRPSPVQTIALLTTVLTLARFLVLFTESYSFVSAERVADVDLLKLCVSGAAADSAKFRALCLKARSESAAPLLLKALLKSFKTAFADFSEALNSPSRIAMLVLFCLSGLALPIVKAVSKLATLHLGPNGTQKLLNGVHGVKFKDEDDENEDCHVVILDSQRQGMLQRFKSKIKRLPSRRDRLLTINDEDDLEDSVQELSSYVPLGQM
jgi:hypothetical protein